MTDTVSIKKIDKYSPSDYFLDIAIIHKTEIEDGFLSTLDTKFLSLIYKHIATSAYSFLFAAIENKRVVGFICGSVDSKKVIYSFVFRFGFRSFPLLAKKLFTFSNAKKFFEVLLYPIREENEHLPESEILNFCINNSLQGRGLGKRLFKELVREYSRRSIKEFKIVTGASQKKAQNFYNAVGAKKVSEINIHGDEPSLMFLYEISG